MPYFWSSMTVRPTGGEVRYETRRPWPGPTATSRVVVRPGARLTGDEIGELDHFLTARWRVFAAVGNWLRHVEAEHDPWPLRRADVVTVNDELVTAAGLPAPYGDPLARYSVDVTAGWAGA